MCGRAPQAECLGDAPKTGKNFHATKKDVFNDTREHEAVSKGSREYLGKKRGQWGWGFTL